MGATDPAASLAAADPTPRAAPSEPDALLRGEGRYVSDLQLPGMLHAAFLRSPFAHARLLALDAGRARAMPGVRAVLLGADVAALGPLAVNSIVQPIRALPRPLLATERVMAVGEAVAMVIAETREQARDAAEQIDVDYDPLPALVDPLQALAAPPVVPGTPDNVLFDQRWQQGDSETVFAAAAHVVEATLAMPRVAPFTLEPRAALAHWDPERRRLECWLPTQSPHRARAELARLLGLEPGAVRVVAPDVGGAFGAKASPYPEDVLVAFAAMRTGRPVRWVATRLEDFLSASHGRGGHVVARLALDADGRALALAADVVFPLGAWLTFSSAVPAWNTARILPGPYAIDTVDLRVRGVVTTTAAVGIYRGAGRPEAALVMERLIEAGARACGLDPMVVRARNAVPREALPRRTPTGSTLDTADFAHLLERAGAIADLDALRREQAARRAAGELVGLGACLYTEPCGTGWESARLRLEADGTVTLASGSTSQGQRHARAYAAIVAETLGVPDAAVRVLEGDTAVSPEGIGALASRSMAIGGSAVLQAARELRERIAAAGGREAAAGSVIEVQTVYTASREGWASGCGIAQVAVDRATGRVTLEGFWWVDDAGRVVDAAGTEAQLVGGFAQGVGSVLTEALRYDEDGQLVTASLLDYAPPRADDLPSRIVLESAPMPTEANLLGARGVGEAGTVVAPAAILNAALDAVAPLGVGDLPLPLTGEHVWRALRAATA